MPVSVDAPRGLAVPLRALVTQVVRAEGRRVGEIAVVLTDDKALRALNRQWRGLDKATDVLSFAYDEHEPDAATRPVTGDLVISMDRVREQAARFRVTRGAELTRLVVHGALHLCGHDHMQAGERREMRAREEAAMRRARAIAAELGRRMGREDASPHKARKRQLSPERPELKLGPRESVEPQLQSYLDGLAACLSRLVNQVWTLQLRSMREGSLGATSRDSVHSLLRQAIAMANGVAALTSASLEEPAAVLLRSEYEACLQLKYMLSDPAKLSERAAAFEVADLRKRLHQAERHDRETNRGAEFARKVERDRSLPEWHLQDFDAAKLEIKRIRAELETERYRSINLEFQGHKGKPNWYALSSGPVDMARLADSLNFGALHQELYSDLSNVAHGGDATRLAIGVDGQSFVRPLRDPTGIAWIAGMAAEVLILAFNPVLFHALPHEAEKFHTWSQQEVLEPLRRLAAVKIKVAKQT